jgi:hypothetical protein
MGREGDGAGKGKDAGGAEAFARFRQYEYKAVRRSATVALRAGPRLSA